MFLKLDEAAPAHLAPSSWNNSAGANACPAAFQNASNNGRIALRQRGILHQVRASKGEGQISEQVAIREEMNTLASQVSADVAYADLQNAYANIFASIGIDPYAGELRSDTSVAALADVLRDMWIEHGKGAGLVRARQSASDYMATGSISKPETEKGAAKAKSPRKPFSFGKFALKAPKFSFGRKSGPDAKAEMKPATLPTPSDAVTETKPAETKTVARVNTVAPVPDTAADPVVAMAPPRGTLVIQSKPAQLANPAATGADDAIVTGSVKPVAKGMTRSYRDPFAKSFADLGLLPKRKAGTSRQANINSTR